MIIDDCDSLPQGSSELWGLVIQASDVARSLPRSLAAVQIRGAVVWIGWVGWLGRVGLVWCREVMDSDAATISWGMGLWCVDWSVLTSSRSLCGLPERWCSYENRDKYSWIRNSFSVYSDASRSVIYMLFTLLSYSLTVFGWCRSKGHAIIREIQLLTTAFNYYCFILDQLWLKYRLKYRLYKLFCVLF